MNIEALAIKGAPVAYRGLAKFLSDLQSRSTNRLQEAMEVDRRSHAARVAQLVEGLIVEWQKQAASVDELRARVEEMVADNQFQRLHANLEYEAVRSTLDDRKEMLAAAAAGLCDPNMSIEDKARVERTLRDLDPADAILLEQVRSWLEWTPTTPQEQLENPASVRFEKAAEIVKSTPMSKGALLTSGCLNAGSSTGAFEFDASWEVTAVGKLVLHVLASFLQKSGHDDAEDGSGRL